MVLGTNEDKLYVELKWTKIRGRALIWKRSLNRIWKDIEKSNVKKVQETAIFTHIYLQEKRGAPPLLESDLNKRQKSKLRQIKKEKKIKGVKKGAKVIFSVYLASHARIFSTLCCIWR